jgi:hypothetical protein
MSLILAEVSDKLTPLSHAFACSLAVTGVAMILGKLSRWLIAPFIVLALIATMAAIVEPMTDRLFWEAVRAEKGPYYHLGYILASLLPLGLLCLAFIYETKRRKS